MQYAKINEEEVKAVVNEVTKMFNDLGELYQYFFNVKLVIVGVQTETDSFSTVGIQYHTMEPHHVTGEAVDTAHFMFCCRADNFAFGWEVYKALAKDYGMEAKIDESIDAQLQDSNTSPTIQVETAIELVA